MMVGENRRLAQLPFKKNYQSLEIQKSIIFSVELISDSNLYNKEHTVNNFLIHVYKQLFFQLIVVLLCKQEIEKQRITRLLDDLDKIRPEGILSITEFVSSDELFNYFVKKLKPALRPQFFRITDSNQFLLSCSENSENKIDNKIEILFKIILTELGFDSIILILENGSSKDQNLYGDMKIQERFGQIEKVLKPDQGRIFTKWLVNRNQGIFEFQTCNSSLTEEYKYHDVEWNSDQLSALIQKRLSVASGRRISSLNQLAVPAIQYPIGSLFINKYKPTPRELISISDFLLRKPNERKEDNFIDQDTIDHACLWFEENRKKVG